MYSFISFCQFGVVDVYFIKLLIIYFSHYYFDAQTVPNMANKNFYSGLLYCFDRLPSCLEHSFTFWHHKELSAHFMLFRPSFG